MTTYRDRTAELFATIHAIQARKGSAASSAVLSSSFPQAPLRTGVVETVSPVQTSTIPTKTSALQQRTQFSSLASKIANGITITTGKLERLAKLAMRQSLFDDRPAEVHELTHGVKEDISRLNGEILQLQVLLQEKKPTSWLRGVSGQREDSSSTNPVDSLHTPGFLGAYVDNPDFREHSSRVIMTLQSRLAQTSTTFKDVLRVRTENIETQRDRRQQFIYGTQKGTSGDDYLSLKSSPTGQGSPHLTGSPRNHSSTGAVQTRRESDQPPDPGGASLIVPVDMSSALYRAAMGGPVQSREPSHLSQEKSVGHHGRFLSKQGEEHIYIDLEEKEDTQSQQLQQFPLQTKGLRDTIVDARSRAIQDIQETMSQLSEIFQQLAFSVQQQGDVVRRIDDNVEMALDNVTLGSHQLVKYLHNISGNRKWIFTAFLILIIFFIVFVLVGV